MKLRRFTLLLLWGAGCLSAASNDTELRFSLRADLRTFDPQQADDDNAETVRYLTGGVLLRVHRVTQEVQPELAVSWKVDDMGRRITFHLRHDVKFSDGTPFTARDVAYTMKRLMDPELHSAIADTFGQSAPPEIRVLATDTVSVRFAKPVASLERVFDQVSILSATSPRKFEAVLGPFMVAAHKPGVEVLLARNPQYWKVDSNGRRLPYVDRVRLMIQQNRDMELVRFRRGEVDLINSLEAESFELLAQQSPGSVTDAGVSLESEMMWFNQAPGSPLPAYKRAWFASTSFRRAVSSAINRDDLCRVVYKGHAHPAVGPISPANRLWVNAALKPHAFDPAGAALMLRESGFVLRAGQLFDREDHLVEFSAITNAGNKSREKMLAMIQQDLKTVGIRLNVVTLDFPSLIERMTKTFQYEVCLLGLTNLELDPSSQMNVWLSSGAAHQWNPNQKTPATPWEAEIDGLMAAQAAELNPARRKKLWDRLQQIVWEQEPFVYLVTKNSLMAFSPQLRNVAPAALQPQAFWSIETMRKVTQVAGAAR